MTVPAPEKLRLSSGMSPLRISQIASSSMPRFFFSPSPITIRRSSLGWVGHHRNAPSGVTFRHTVRLQLHQPIAIDEPFDFDEGVGWLDVAEKLPVRTRRRLPTSDIGKHHPRPNEGGQGAASLGDRLRDDL